MKIAILIGVLGGAAVVGIQAPRDVPVEVVTDLIDAPQPLKIRGHPVLVGPGNFICHDGALGIRIAVEGRRHRVEFVFGHGSEATHTHEVVSEVPIGSDWFVMAERIDRVWCVTGRDSVLRVDWQKNPVTGKRSLSETSYTLPMDADLLMKANPPREVAARLAP